MDLEAIETCDKELNKQDAINGLQNRTHEEEININIKNLIEQRQ